MKAGNNPHQYSRDVGKRVNKVFAEDARATNGEGAVLAVLASFEALKQAPKVEDYYSDEKDYEVQAYRYICGVEEGCVKFGELVFVYASFIDQARFDKIAQEVAMRKFFIYHPGHEELFCRSVYVMADRFEGFIRARGNRKKNIFVVPVLGRDRAVRIWIYFADFIKERIESFVGSLIHGWRKTRREHDVYVKFKNLLNFGMLRRGVRNFSNSFLYYINIIESKIEEIEESGFSERIIESLKVLLNIFKTALKYIDRLLEPIMENRIAEAAFKSLKEVFGVHFVELAAKLALKQVLEMERKMVKSFFKKLDNAEVRCRLLS